MCVCVSVCGVIVWRGEKRGEGLYEEVGKNVCVGVL